MNFGPDYSGGGERECPECHRSDFRLIEKSVDGEDEWKCQFCETLGETSRHLDRVEAFVVREGIPEDRWLGLPLPFGYRLIPLLRKKDEKDEREKASFEEAYQGDDSKGLGSIVHMYRTRTGNADAQTEEIWLASYCADMGKDGISAYDSDSITLESGKGIKRLGILRADVDNLGTTFTEGLPASKRSFVRGSVLSRRLNYFFKVDVDRILEQGQYRAQVIYSGGDDLFLIGNWSDIIYAAMDIRSALAEYVGNDSITLSAGIGIYGSKYPIARMAGEVGELEDAAKLYCRQTTEGPKEKNALALWSDANVFSWDEFNDEVATRKNMLDDIFKDNEKGKAFMYRLLSLLRNYDEAVSAPRLAYLLARSFESEKGQSRDNADTLYSWSKDKDKRRFFIAALEWYVYGVRERG